jgi:hypothetical protein
MFKSPHKRLYWSLTVLCIFFSQASAWAGDIDWSGTYRIEGVKVENAEVNNEEKNKQYILHHLVLKPKITAYDGLTIHGRFDIMNAGTYPNSQVGQFFGNGVGTASPGSSANNSILSDNQSSEMIAVNELYLTFVQEFGVLTVGRAPLQFGLGMSYNAGAGAFDHWFDNRDMVAYKMSFGNLTLTPMIAKVVEGEVGYEDDIDDYMVQLMYENPDSELKLGAMYRIRHAGRYGNVAPGTPVFGDGAGAGAASAGFKGEYLNLFFQRWVGDSFKIGVEASTQKGETGVVSTGGQVDMDAYGVAVEIDWVPKASSFHMGLKAGVASGDDVNTVNNYEGFMFDRNYDVAFLLFNHPLGRYDIFRTAGNSTPPTSVENTYPSFRADEETISNVMYFAPHFKYKWSDTFDSQFGLTYAQLNSDPISGRSVDKAAGFEVDITLNYKPYDNVQWMNRLGVFAPGAAFEAGGLNDPQTVYGIETKAAITF